MIIKSKAKALVSVLLSSAMILSLVGCKSNEEPVAEKPTVEVKTEEPASSSSETIEETTDPNALAPGMMRSFLSGLPVDEKIGNRRPVAIMLNNLEAAQPMSGVSRQT